MSYRLQSIPQTELDIADAYNWYESERSGLGGEFLSELRAVYDRIEENPLNYQVLKFDIRRALTRRFPYAIYFLVDNRSVVILAVLHAARNPTRWQHRRSYRVSEP
jgi:plasmid stabilization system protein ParE